MPFVKLKRAHKYSVSTRNALLIVVELLDQKVMECSVGVESLAQECLDIVLSRLQISEETFYFGLQHLNKQHRYRWLELDKSLRKQLARATNTLGDYRLRFGVMYFAPEMSCLQFRQTRLMFFLHFKRMIYEGAITCSLDTACTLASYALQAEYGDFNPMAHNMKFLQYYPVFPTKYYGNAPEELFEKVLKLYQERRGMSGEEAEMMYLNEVQQRVEDYSVEFMRAKMTAARTTEKSKEDVMIGTSPVGITLRSELGEVTAAPIHRQTASDVSEVSVNSGSKEFISWSRIHRMLYKDCIFLVIKLDKSELKVVLESAVDSRYFWVRSIGNHLIYRQSKLMGDGFCAPLNNSDTMSNFGGYYGKAAAYNTGAVVNNIDERKLLRGGDMSTCENNGTHKWNKTGSYQDMGSEHDSGSAVGSTTNMESPFSIRYAYPSLFRRNATLQKRRPPSVAARHETSMDSSFNDSGNTYAQLVFNSSTLKVTKGTDAVDSQNVVTRKSATYGPDQSNTDVFKSSNLASEKKAATIPSYDSFMSRRVSQHQRLLFESGGQHVSSHPNLATSEFQRRNSSRRLASMVNHKYGRPVPPKPTAGHNVRTAGHMKPNASSATGPISLDSNRYNYFDNLAAIGQEDDVIHDDGVHEDAYINGRPPQCVCGALPTYMFSSPTVPHAAMLANRHMSFSGANNERQEEHSASLSPYTSPLNHAISSPELNCFHALYHNEMQLQSSYPRSQYHQQCHMHDFSRRHATDSYAFHNNPSQSAAAAALSSKLFQPAYMQYHQHHQSQQKLFTSTPELYHAHSVSDLEHEGHQNVHRVHSNDVTHSHHLIMSNYNLRKRSDPLPPTPGSIFRRNLHQAGTAVYDDSPHVYDLQPSAANSCSSLATTPVNPTASSHSLNQSGKQNLLGVNFSSRRMEREIERDPSEDVAGNGNNISTWSISPLARFKSTDQLDKLSDCDNDTSHPYCDPEIAERRRNNPLAYQGDMRRSFIERKIVDGVLQDEYSGIILQKTSAKYSLAKMTENFSRNRFSAYLPYDDTIVKLTPSRELNPLGYINASWIKTKIAGITYRYIATQNPMDGTCMDFWQMILEKQVTVIVMFANEGGSSSSLNSNGDEHLEYSSRSGSRSSYCAKYKPGRVGEIVEFGHISIVAETIQHTEYCVATTLKLTNRKEMRSTVLWHLQCTNLPFLLPSKSAAHGSSQDVSDALQSDIMRSSQTITSFIQFLNEIRSIRLLTREEGIDGLPIAVHCATGNGASGAFILAEIMMTLIEHQEAIDVARVLTFLRYQRPHMVDSYLYYEFVHRVIIQSLALVRLI